MKQIKVRSDRFIVTLPENVEQCLSYYQHSPVFKIAVDDNLRAFSDHEPDRYTIRGFFHIYGGTNLVVDTEKVYNELSEEEQ